MSVEGPWERAHCQGISRLAAGEVRDESIFLALTRDTASLSLLTSMRAPVCLVTLCMVLTDLFMNQIVVCGHVIHDTYKGDLVHRVTT